MSREPLLRCLMLGAAVWVLCRISVKPTQPALGAGIEIEGSELKLISWDRWMEVAPAMVKVSLEEGHESAEEIVANLMRRLYPLYQWPPEKDSLRWGLWMHLVETVSHSLNKQHTPQLQVITGA